MSAIPYLYLTTIKNSLKQLKKHPSKLITYLVFLALLVFVLISPNFSGGSSQMPQGNMSELSAMVFALYLFVLLPGVMRGFSSGASFFSMADVNLLFSTPISKKKILLYGMIKQLGTTLMVGFFLLFQYAWLNERYGLSVGGLLIILLGYSLTIFLAQLLAMLIYSFTSGDDVLRKKVKTAVIALVVLTVAGMLFPLLRVGTFSLAAAVEAANAPWLSFFPVAGWLRCGAAGAIAGQWLPPLLSLCAWIVATIGLVMVITKSRADFYEDVLKATEVSFTAITAAKEGKMQDASPTNVKVGRTGLGKGWGSSAFYYKHRIENRRARVFFLDMMSLTMLGVSLLFAFFMRSMDGNIIAVFAFSTYMQFFSVATGRWAKELLFPFVYLIPDKPFRKLVMICMESIQKSVLEALLFYIPVMFLLKASPLVIFACVLARVGFGLLFIAGNVLMERVFGSLINKALIIILYFLMMILLAAPGVVGGVFLAMALPEALRIAAAFLVIFLWNVLISAAVVFFCRNILDYAELNNR